MQRRAAREMCRVVVLVSCTSSALMRKRFSACQHLRTRRLNSGGVCLGKGSQSSPRFWLVCRCIMIWKACMFLNGLVPVMHSHKRIPSAKISHFSFTCMACDTCMFTHDRNDIRPQQVETPAIPAAATGRSTPDHQPRPLELCMKEFPPCTG